jgi:hypothetical protein
MEETPTVEEETTSMTEEEEEEEEEELTTEELTAAATAEAERRERVRLRGRGRGRARARMPHQLTTEEVRRLARLARLRATMVQRTVEEVAERRAMMEVRMDTTAFLERERMGESARMPSPMPPSSPLPTTRYVHRFSTSSSSSSSSSNMQVPTTTATRSRSFLSLLITSLTALVMLVVRLLRRR